MKNNTRVTVEAGVMIALATVLSLIKIYQAPQGGSVTAGSMIPIILIALRWGPRAGIVTGAVYGALQLMIEPYIVHPVQVLLDYIVPFGFLGVAGYFSRQPIVGVMLGIAGRLVSHVISGVVFFAEYAPEGTPVLLYSITYNASYLALEALISAVVIYLLSATRVLSWQKPGAR